MFKKIVPVNHDNNPHNANAHTRRTNRKMPLPKTDAHGILLDGTPYRVCIVPDNPNSEYNSRARMIQDLPRSRFRTHFAQLIR
jgi:hypothetical protein